MAVRVNRREWEGVRRRRRQIGICFLNIWERFVRILCRMKVVGGGGGCVQEVMRDPVVWVDGMSYEREAIVMWLRDSDMSPVIQESFPGQKTEVVPNFTLRSLIKEWKERTGYSDE